MQIAEKMQEIHTGLSASKPHKYTVRCVDMILLLTLIAQPKQKLRNVISSTLDSPQADLYLCNKNTSLK